MATLFPRNITCLGNLEEIINARFLITDGHETLNKMKSLVFSEHYSVEEAAMLTGLESLGNWEESMNPADQDAGVQYYLLKWQGRNAYKNASKEHLDNIFEALEMMKVLESTWLFKVCTFFQTLGTKIRLLFKR